MSPGCREAKNELCCLLRTTQIAPVQVVLNFVVIVFSLYNLENGSVAAFVDVF